MNKFEEKKAKKEKSKETNSNKNDSISRNNSYYQNQFLSESINNENSFSNILNTNPSIVLPSLTLTNESSHKNRSKGSILFEKYSPRKDIFKSTKLPIVTYVEPFDFLKDKKYYLN